LDQLGHRETLVFKVSKEESVQWGLVDLRGLWERTGLLGQRAVQGHRVREANKVLTVDHQEFKELPDRPVQPDLKAFRDLEDLTVLKEQKETWVQLGYKVQKAIVATRELLVMTSPSIVSRFTTLNVFRVDCNL
jgi:hypothetical protein